MLEATLAEEISVTFEIILKYEIYIWFVIGAIKLYLLINNRHNAIEIFLMH